MSIVYEFLQHLTFTTITIVTYGSHLSVYFGEDIESDKQQFDEKLGVVTNLTIVKTK